MEAWMSSVQSTLDPYLTPNRIYWTIIACLWVEYAFELYLCFRQKKVYRDSKVKIPQELTLDKGTFEKSRVYGMDKNFFSMFHDFYSMAILTTLLNYEGLYKGWVYSGRLLDFLKVWPSGCDREIGQSITFIILALLFNTAVGLPVSIYSTFVLEKNHGFNKQTAGFFIKDQMKGVAVNAVITAPIIALVVKIMQMGGPYFFVWLWIFCFVLLIFLMTIYPLAIAPLFDKYTPLKDGPLKERIAALAGRIKFPLTRLYVVEGSKRSAHSNAYLYGLFNNKRIVLYDTLIKVYVMEEESKEKEKAESSSQGQEKPESSKEKEEKGCTDEEIEAVLGHELGHWKINHVVKNIVISQVNLLFTFALFASFYQNSKVYETFGFPKYADKPILLGLIIVLQFLLQTFNTIMGFMMHVVVLVKFVFERLHAVDDAVQKRDDVSTTPPLSLTSPLLKSLGKYIIFILRVFGMIESNDLDSLGFKVPGAAGAGAANVEEIIRPFVEVLSEFREHIRFTAKSIQDPSIKSAILKACDEIRYEKLPNLGVRLEDHDGSPTVIKYVGKEVMLREKGRLEAERAAEEEKRKEVMLREKEGRERLEAEQEKRKEEKVRAPPPVTFHKSTSTSTRSTKSPATPTLRAFKLETQASGDDPSSPKLTRSPKFTRASEATIKSLLDFCPADIATKPISQVAITYLANRIEKDQMSMKALTAALEMKVAGTKSSCVYIQGDASRRFHMENEKLGIDKRLKNPEIVYFAIWRNRLDILKDLTSDKMMLIHEGDGRVQGDARCINPFHYELAK